MSWATIAFAAAGTTMSLAQGIQAQEAAESSAALIPEETNALVQSHLLSGQEAQDLARYKAQALTYEQEFVQQQAEMQVSQQDYRAEHVLSDIRLKAAASGVEFSGSPEMVFNTSAHEAMVNDMYTRYAANVKSSEIEYEKKTIEVSGDYAMLQARYGAIADVYQGEFEQLKEQEAGQAALYQGVGGALGGISRGITEYGLYSGQLDLNTYSDDIMLQSLGNP